MLADGAPDVVEGSYYRSDQWHLHLIEGLLGQLEVILVTLDGDARSFVQPTHPRQTSRTAVRIDQQVTRAGRVLCQLPQQLQRLLVRVDQLVRANLRLIEDQVRPLPVTRPFASL